MKIKIGDRVSGGRIEKYYATVESIEGFTVGILYNGTVKTVFIDTRDPKAEAILSPSTYC